MTSRRTLAALVVVPLLSLSACAQAQDAAKDAGTKAACALAKQAVDGIKGQADDAVDNLDADPAAAEKKLSALRDAVSAAEGRVSGSVKDKLGEVRDALADLATQAGDAAKGSDVDTSAVSNAKDQLAKGVDDVSNAC